MLGHAHPILNQTPPYKNTPWITLMATAHERFEELWDMLTTKQKQYVAMRQQCSTIKAAAAKAGVPRSTVYSWPDEVEACAEAAARSATESAMKVIKDAVLEAALGKVDEMKGMGGDAAKARTEILDRAIGKATQRQEIEQTTTHSVDEAAMKSSEAAVKEVLDRLSGGEKCRNSAAFRTRSHNLAMWAVE